MRGMSPLEIVENCRPLKNMSAKGQKITYNYVIRLVVNKHGQND